MSRVIFSLTNWRKVKSFLGVTSSGIAIFVGISLYQGNEKFYNNVAMPLIYLIDPEFSHRLAVATIKLGLVPSQKISDSSILHSKLWDLKFENPLGIAAGFDKHGEAIKGLHKMGFGFVEIGEIF
jgi:dihydroorotate dehydrogenase